jgi:CRP-like cAMP-binding protein
MPESRAAAFDGAMTAPVTLSDLIARAGRPPDASAAPAEVLPALRRDLAAGEMLVAAGAPATDVVAVDAGLLRLVATRSDGRRRIFGFTGPGEVIIPERGTAHRWAVQAVGPTTCRQIPLPAFAAAIEGHSALLTELHDWRARARSEAYDRLAQLGGHSAAASVAGFLLELDRRAGEVQRRQGWLRLLISRADIADYLGLSQATVSRLLTTLRRKRLIEVARARHLRLLDRAGLAALAGCDEAARPV